ncbi:hypothetical protein FQA47_003943 [Oryzias melastigma]|uniref:Uncharacterized protein n=1 Tax=Oryzias melastigma TaxID=30732 RepID=A0A834CA01_ORYME|nr:hypothetical protein FQA47_003943 [Oryzias melastigma]
MLRPHSLFLGSSALSDLGLRFLPMASPPSHPDQGASYPLVHPGSPQSSWVWVPAPPSSMQTCQSAGQRGGHQERPAALAQTGANYQQSCFFSAVATARVSRQQAPAAASPPRSARLLGGDCCVAARLMQDDLWRGGNPFLSGRSVFSLLHFISASLSLTSSSSSSSLLSSVELSSHGGSFPIPHPPTTSSSHTPPKIKAADGRGITCS